MFNFVLTDEEIDRKADSDFGKFFPVTEADIERIEKKFKITFPEILREYYLKHNAKFINGVTIQEPGGEEADIYNIIPLIGTPLDKDGLKNEYSVECIKDNEMNEPEELGCLRIRNNFIPLALDMGCNIYYWDSNDGKVYISFNDNDDEDGLEIPYFVCSSVEEMFGLMDEAYEKMIKNESN